MPPQQQVLTQFAYNLFGQTQQQTATSLIETLYDRLGRVRLQRNSPAQETVFRYNEAGERIAVINWTKRAYYTDTENYSPGSIVNAPWQSHTTVYDFDPLGRKVLQVAVNDGMFTRSDGKTYSYDAIVTYAYDALGRMVSKTDANRRATTGRGYKFVVPDPVNNPGIGTWTIDDAMLGNTPPEQWLSANKPGVKQFVFGVPTVDDRRLALDASRFWRLRADGSLDNDRAAQSGRRTDYTYNALGQLIREQWLVTETGFADRPLAEVGRLAYVYDAQGRLLESLHLAFNPKVETWGALDWQGTTADFGMLHTDRGLIQFPDADNPRAIKSYGVVHTFGYDGLGRRVLEVTNDGQFWGLSDALIWGGGVKLTYDAAGRRTSLESVVSDGNKSFEIYKYDGAGRLSEIGYGMTGLGDDAGTYHVKLAYDQKNIPGLGNVTLDRTHAVSHYTPNTPLDAVADLEHTDLYDDAGRLKLRASTFKGDPLHSIGYHYDLNGWMDAETRTGAPGPHWFIQDEYSNYHGGAFMHTQQELNKDFSLDAVKTFAYDELGQVKHIHLVETVRGSDDDPEFLVTHKEMPHDANGGPVFDSYKDATAPSNPDRVRRKHVRDGDTNELKIVDTVYDGEGNQLASIAYQPLPDGGVDVQARWVYTVDHRNQTVKASLQPQLTPASANSTLAFGQRLEVNYRYDAEGQLVHRFEAWKADPAPQVQLGSSFAAATEDIYGERFNIPGDAFGNTSYIAREFHFIYDGNNFAGYMADGYTHIVWGQGVDQALARQSTNTNQSYGAKWYVTDRQGDVLGVLNPDGTWAKVTTYAGPGAERRWVQPRGDLTLPFYDELELAGRYTDFITGLQNNRARWFNPANGQFTAKDSLGYDAGDTNLYRYAGNSWPNATDPSGHIIITAMVAATLTFTGAALGAYHAGYANGRFDRERAAAGLASGAMIGAGVGLMLFPGGFSQVAASTFLQAGMRSAMQGRVWDRNVDWNPHGWTLGMAQGMVVGFASGATSVFGGRILGSGAIGQMTNAGVTAGTANYVDQYVSGGPVNWRQVAAVATAGAIMGFVGYRANTRVHNLRGQIRCEATQGPTAYLSYVGRNAAVGGASGALNYTAIWATTDEKWDNKEFMKSVAMGAAGVWPGAMGGAAGAIRRWQSARVCFVAGTPLLTPEGSKPIEKFRIGDLLLSRDENNPEGPVEAKQVEEVFIRYGRVLNLKVAGQVIGTTAEHPFWVHGKGWLPAGEIIAGDHLVGHDGRWAVVEGKEDTGDCQVVYNARVGEYHTYFVGSEEWGFSIWAHNACLQPVGVEPGHRYPPSVRGADAQKAYRSAVGGAGYASYPKHHKARTVDQAIAFSSGKGAAAQYLPELTTAKAGHLERTALQRGFVEDHRGAYYAYIQFDGTVGYDGGVATSWIRAELSGRGIHGHPMRPERLPQAVREHLGL